MKKLILLLLFATAALAVPAGMKRLTHGFRLAKMRLEVVPPFSFEMAPLSQEEESKMKTILGQPFYYLDRGAQCYVFKSQDGEYVLKLFRYDQPLNPLRALFQKCFKKKKEKAPLMEKVERLFSACTIAYTKAKEETGLIFLHLNETQGVFPKVKIIGPLGKRHEIALDHYRFAVQKRAATLREVFLDLYQKKEKERARKALYALEELLMRRVNLGIVNSDPNLSRNFGFIGEKAVEIDFGSYAESETPIDASRERALFLHKLLRWFSEDLPEWRDLIEE